MFKIKAIQLIIGIFLVCSLASCGSKKKIASRKNENRREVVSKNNKDTPAEVNNNVRKNTSFGSYADIVQEYIDEFAHIAIEEMELYKIPASITLAQGILESGAGRGSLSQRANNHFGIKCHDWDGDKVYHDDDKSQECFRKYNDPKFSYRDHSLFLSTRNRYADLFELDLDDYEGWAKGLRAAGYATDRQYPNKLIDLIERYNLDKYDGGKPRKRSRSQEVVQVSYSSKYVVQKGDTLYAIAKRNNTTVELLQEINNLADTNISIGQELILQNTSR
tara:strand:- start:602 stop:1432 length:831 start_codon:yes stop_codon:yes gene_type:complete